MGVTVHKNSLENCNLLTKSGFSRKKVDYFDGNLLNKKMVVTKMLTKSRLLTILQVTKSGFHCTIMCTSAGQKIRERVSADTRK